MDIKKEAIYTFTLTHPEASALRSLLSELDRMKNLPDILRELEDSLDRIM